MFSLSMCLSPNRFPKGLYSWQRSWALGIPFDRFKKGRLKNLPFGKRYLVVVGYGY
jgi:hypothetical protein